MTKYARVWGRIEVIEVVPVHCIDGDIDDDSVPVVIDLGDEPVDLFADLLEDRIFVLYLSKPVFSA